MRPQDLKEAIRLVEKSSMTLDTREETCGSCGLRKKANWEQFQQHQELRAVAAKLTKVLKTIETKVDDQDQTQRFSRPIISDLGNFWVVTEDNGSILTFESTITTLVEQLETGDLRADQITGTYRDRKVAIRASEQLKKR